MLSTVICRFCAVRRSLRASLTVSRVISRPLKREYAITLFSAPSSSRTFERMCLAMKKATSSDSLKVAQPGTRMLRENEDADRVKQVGLSQAHATVDEERVVRCTGMFGDLQRGGARELIGFSGDKTLEAEFWNEARALSVRRSKRERACSADRGGGRLNRLRCGRCFEIERYADWGREEFCPHGLDARHEPLFYPLQHKTVGSEQTQLPGWRCRSVQFERPDPGIKLLSRKLFFEASQARGPETLHGDLSGSVRGKQRNDFTRFLESYPQPEGA